MHASIKRATQTTRLTPANIDHILDGVSPCNDKTDARGRKPTRRTVDKYRRDMEKGYWLTTSNNALTIGHNTETGKKFLIDGNHRWVAIRDSHKGNAVEMYIDEVWGTTEQLRLYIDHLDLGATRNHRHQKNIMSMPSYDVVAAQLKMEESYADGILYDSCQVSPLAIKDRLTSVVKERYENAALAWDNAKAKSDRIEAKSNRAILTKPFVLAVIFSLLEFMDDPIASYDAYGRQLIVAIMEMDERLRDEKDWADRKFGNDRIRPGNKLLFIIQFLREHFSGHDAWDASTMIPKYSSDLLTLTDLSHIAKANGFQ